MVIGNGLLATAFSNYKGDNSILIFASGVSNSGNTNLSEFEREKSLLKSALDLKLRLIYFSILAYTILSCKTAHIYYTKKKLNY